jgi:WD40 repeat protein
MVDTPSITNRVRPVAAGAPVVGIHFFADTPVFVLGEEALLFAAEQGERRVGVHAGAILSSAADSKHIVTGGDDGTVAVTDAQGNHRILVTDAKKRWIDHVALGPDGALAWSAAKTAFVRTAKNTGDDRAIDAPTTVAGLAFAPKGFRLAITHYNGVMLWFPNAQAAPETLEWKGSHLGVTFSRDGKFLITAMQEPALHGWRLSDGRNMRMTGYSARVRAMDWTADGVMLATSGSEQVILWPFDGKDGPRGKQPRMIAPAGVRVTAVACHPRHPVIAAGYADGTVLLVRIDDDAEIIARRPGGVPVTALGWNATGTVLAFGTDDGEAGVARL